MMADKTAQQQRVRGRPFAKGTSGNPNGRKAGSRNRATVLALEILDDEAPELVRKAVELALAGDPAMLRLCIGKLIPDRRDLIEVKVNSPLDALDFDAMSTEQLQLVADAFEKIEQASRMGVRALPGVIIDQDE